MRIEEPTASKLYVICIVFIFFIHICDNSFWHQSVKMDIQHWMGRWMHLSALPTTPLHVINVWWTLIQKPLLGTIAPGGLTQNQCTNHWAKLYNMLMDRKVNKWPAPKVADYRWCCCLAVIWNDCLLQSGKWVISCRHCLTALLFLLPS